MKMNKKLNEAKNKINELISNSESMIVATDKGIAMVGCTPELLFIIENILRHAKEMDGVDDSVLNTLVKMASDKHKEMEEELFKDISEGLDKFFSDLEKKIKKGDRK